jgi:hypothetical protein
MNTMKVHDFHSNEDFLAFVGHDNNSIHNVQATYHGEPKNPLIVDILKLCMMMHLSPKCIWRFFGNKGFYGSYIIVLHSHGVF